MAIKWKAQKRYSLETDILVKNPHFTEFIHLNNCNTMKYNVIQNKYNEIDHKNTCQIFSRKKNIYKRGIF